jgi:hypothetical protein
MAVEFNLPGSSLEEVQKILKGYSNVPDNSALDAVAKIVGMHTTSISQNNKFLTDLGLIEGTKRKSATELGKRLGRALDHNQSADIRRYWIEGVQTNDKVSGLVTTVRIRGGMTETDLSDHILYVSGQSNNARNRTGARCVVDVLLAAGLIEESDGKVQVATPSSVELDIGETQTNAPPEPPVAGTTVVESDTRPTDSAALPRVPVSHVPQIAINIQLHLPETENAEVYEKLFRALREQLLSPTS